MNIHTYYAKWYNNVDYIMSRKVLETWVILVPMGQPCMLFDCSPWDRNIMIFDFHKFFFDTILNYCKLHNNK